MLNYFFPLGKGDISSLMRTALEELDGPGKTDLVRGWDSASKDCMSNAKCKSKLDSIYTFDNRP